MREDFIHVGDAVYLINEAKGNHWYHPGVGIVVAKVWKPPMSFYRNRPWIWVLFNGVLNYYDAHYLEKICDA